MANTYTQIHIHAVFCVKNRFHLIRSDWRDELYKYLTGIVQRNGHKLLIVNGMPDHLHMLIGIRPSQSLSDLMQDIKQDSSKWINRRKFTSQPFSCQTGFGAFSVGTRDLGAVMAYIQNQEQHHTKRTFQEEYKQLLEDFQVEFDERFLFLPVDYDQ
jgi:putative transposase